MEESEIKGFMKRALALAAKGSGTAHPNPMVGAVVVSEGRIVGEGWHQKPGEPHAEVLALEQAGPAAMGSALFVNLEPCSHYGRTPPCSRAVIQAGITHVYAACCDPNRLVRGQGFQSLRAAGIKVTEGVLEREARELNRAFFHFCRGGTPYITLKMASTLDGRIAAGDGNSKWITGEKARKKVHQLRGQADAILVGVGTVTADNPKLTARGVGRVVQPPRIVLDPVLRTPLDSVILSREMADSTILVIGEDVPEDRCSVYRQTGVLILRLPTEEGVIRWSTLAGPLVDKGILHVLVEGGGVTASWIIQERSVNRLELFMAPRILGASGIPVVADMGNIGLDEATGLFLKRIRRIGDDLHITAEPK